MSVAVKETAKNEKDGGFSTPSDFRSHFLEIRLLLEIHHTTLACRSYVIPLPPDNSLESLERKCRDYDLLLPSFIFRRNDDNDCFHKISRSTTETNYYCNYGVSADYFK